MNRTFAMLAAVSTVVLIATMALGLAIGNLYANPPDPAALTSRQWHMLAGLIAALVVVFVESLAATYFIGTSRWCKEVTETYRLPPGDLAESVRLKRRTFPWCVLGMFTVVGIIALGAASDPGTGLRNTRSMAQVHLVAAIAGLCFIAWTYFQVWSNIAANQQVIARIVAQVAHIRQQRGLDPKPESTHLQLMPAGQKA